MTEETVATTIDRDDPLPPEEGESAGALASDAPDEVDDETTEDDVEPDEDEPEAGGEA
jgi:hypothetical protein